MVILIVQWNVNLIFLFLNPLEFYFLYFVWLISILCFDYCFLLMRKIILFELFICSFIYPLIPCINYMSFIFFPPPSIACPFLCGLGDYSMSGSGFFPKPKKGIWRQEKTIFGWEKPEPLRIPPPGPCLII